MAIACVSAGMVAGCSSSGPTGQTELAAAVDPDAAEEMYRLGPGDKINIHVYDEPRHSGEFEISASGNVALPLIGSIQAAGLTLPEFEQKVEEELRDGYLVDPRLTTEVTNYGPFYILGDVGSPGRYPYSEGMTIENAVALAGGYGTFANQNRAYVKREGRDTLIDVRDPSNFRILPGDTIRIPIRAF